MTACAGLEILVGAAMLALVACGGAEPPNEEARPDASAPAATDEIETRSAQPYCHGGGAEQVLDLARPVDRSGSPRPGLLFVHGGGWSDGDRSLHSMDVSEAARRGYVAATIEYRLARIGEFGEVLDPFPVQLTDVKCAIRWMRANADQLGVDPSRIGLVGASAGAHLALLAALTGDDFFADAEDWPDVSNRVRAVVNIYGPTDLIRLHQTSPDLVPILEAVFSGDPADPAVAALYTAASPSAYVHADMPPVLTIHGTADALVPVEQASILDALATSAGAPHTLITFEGEGHGFGPENARRSLDQALDFADDQLD